MAYNTKPIVKDVDGNPISQYYNPDTDSYEPVEGVNGANKVLVMNNDLSLIPILEKLSQLTVIVEDDLVAHKADNAAHGATASAIANRIVVRDGSGGASFSNFGLSPTRSTIDLNDRLVNGWSTANTNTPNTPEEGVQGILLTSMWDNNAASFQLFNVLTATGEDKFYFRSRTNRIWRPWVKMWHNGNAIVDSNGFLKEV